MTVLKKGRVKVSPCRHAIFSGVGGGRGHLAPFLSHEVANRVGVSCRLAVVCFNAASSPRKTRAQISSRSATGGVADGVACSTSNAG